MGVFGRVRGRGGKPEGGGREVVSRRWGVSAAAAVVALGLVAVGSVLAWDEGDLIHRDWKGRRDDPILFIGGVPRSGTTLMRVLMDAHPDVRCGEETHIIPTFLEQQDFRASDNKNQPSEEWLKNQRKLDAAGVTKELQHEAQAAYLLRIIEGHGPPAKYLCNKDPLVLWRIPFILDIFPNARLVMMVRDGRAVAHSIVERDIGIGGTEGILVDHEEKTGYNRKVADALDVWAVSGRRMDKWCTQFSNNCMAVVYERLVADREAGKDMYLRRIFEHARIPWHDAALDHTEALRTGETTLSNLEASTDQVVEAVHTGAVAKWVKTWDDQIKSECKDPKSKGGWLLRHFGYVDSRNRDVTAPVYPLDDDWLQFDDEL